VQAARLTFLERERLELGELKARELDLRFPLSARRSPVLELLDERMPRRKALGRCGCDGSELTACATSAADASATRACTSPVFGLKTSLARPEVPSTRPPAMKWGMWRMVKARRGRAG
jgi:hypothetical protein